MGFYASVNGEITPAEEARVSVLDNGFTFGDAVYETLRTYAGRPFHLDRHLERLRRSAQRLAIAVPAGVRSARSGRAARAGRQFRIVHPDHRHAGRGDISYPSTA
jgi:branched-subunit amino acid aminotransferase/4-amino-4-deoxychorismate lyase